MDAACCQETGHEVSSCKSMANTVLETQSYANQGRFIACRPPKQLMSVIVPGGRRIPVLKLPLNSSHRPSLLHINVVLTGIRYPRTL